MRKLFVETDLAHAGAKALKEESEVCYLIIPNKLAWCWALGSKWC
jgi:hypothetical protein